MRQGKGKKVPEKKTVSGFRERPERRFQEEGAISCFFLSLT
jgi:hypothetical protein